MNRDSSPLTILWVRVCRCVCLQLDRRVTWTPGIQRIRFQRDGEEVPEGTVCRVAGWGWVNNVGIKPENLQEVEVKVISHQLCSRRDYYGGRITSNMMCAGQQGKDSCQVLNDPAINLSVSLHQPGCNYQ